MTQRQQRAYLSAMYLESLEREDYARQCALWKRAESDPELMMEFHRVHCDLIEERNAEDGMKNP